MWRVATRRPLPIVLFAGGCRTPRRPLHVSLPRAQIYPPRGPGFYARLKFRKDGTPRSRLMGAFLGFSLLLNVLLFGSLVALIVNETRTHSGLRNLVRLLIIDEEYHSIDLDDPVATMKYFNSMFLAIVGSGSEANMEEYLELVISTLRHQGEKDPLGKVHVVLRSSVERIHQLLVEPDFTKYPYTLRWTSIGKIINETVVSFLGFVQGGVQDSSFDDHSKQDTETASSDYELLG